MVPDQPVSWHAIDHTIRLGSEEPGITVDHVADAFFAWHFSFLPLASFCGGGAKTVGTVIANGWRERPMGHFASRRIEKWGRSRPSECFCPACIFHSSSLYLCACSRLTSFEIHAETERPPGTRLFVAVQAASSPVARKSGCFVSRTVSKSTLRLVLPVVNSDRISVSVIRPDFQSLSHVSKGSPLNLCFAWFRNRRSSLLSVLNSAVSQSACVLKYRTRSGVTSHSRGVRTSAVNNSLAFSKCIAAFEI